MARSGRRGSAGGRSGPGVIRGWRSVEGAFKC